MLEILDILVKTFLIMGSLYILMEAILMAKHYIYEDQKFKCSHCVHCTDFEKNSEGEYHGECERKGTVSNISECGIFKRR